MRKIIEDERGSLLVTVLMIGLILIILSTALATLSLSEIKDTAASRDKTQAYYVARSGVEATVQKLMNMTNLEKKNIRFPTSFTGNIGAHEYLVELTGSLEEIKIESTGKVNAREETVTHILKGDINSSTEVELDMAVFAQENIILDGSAKIHGDIVMNATKPGSIDLAGGGTGINGDIYIGPGGDKEKFLKKPDWMDFDVKKIHNLPSQRVYSSPTMPNFPENLFSYGNITLGGNDSYTISEDGYFNEIKIMSNTRLTIDVGSEERIIRVKRLNIEQGYIDIKGTGKLKIYVDEYFYVKGFINQKGNSEQVTIYYNGDNKVTISNETKMAANFYSGSANLSITGSGGLKGNIISAASNIDISGGAIVEAIVVYAPNAYIHISANKFTGAIISKALRATGNAQLHYPSNASDFIPIETEGSGDIQFERGIWK